MLSTDELRSYFESHTSAKAVLIHTTSDTHAIVVLDYDGEVFAVEERSGSGMPRYVRGSYTMHDSLDQAMADTMSRIANAGAQHVG